MKLYGLIALVSAFVRQFMLPNPFECFGDSAVLINWIAEPIIHVVTYFVVGIFYVRGSEPTLGSLLYLITYVAIIGILWLMGIFSFSWWWIAIIVAALVAIVWWIC